MAKNIIIAGGGDALTVIDLQNDFFHPTGRLYVSGVEGEVDAKEMLKRINSLVEMPFDWIACSRDKHPDDHIEFSIFGRHCPIMEEGSDLVSELERPKSSWDLIEKGYDKDVISYSIVTSAGFPVHMKHLREKNIKRVFICGLAYTHCVGESAIAYASQGFETYVIRDATRSVSPPYGDPELMDKKLALYDVKLINSEDIIS